MKKSLSEQTHKDHISFSQMNTFLHCKCLYRKLYIAPDKKEIDSKERIFGSFQHDVIAMLNKYIKSLKSKETMGVEDIENIYRNCSEKVNLSLESYKQGYDNIEKIALEKFTRKAEIMLVEEPIRIELVFKEQSIILEGRVDEVDTMPQADAIKIIDYKSSPLVPTRSQVLHDWQLNIYAIIMKTIYPEKRIFLERYSIGAGIGIGDWADEAVMAKTKDFVIDLWQKMEREKEWLPTDINEFCQYCPSICEIYKQRMFEKYESKGVTDIETAIEKFDKVRSNRLLMEKEEDNIQLFIKMKYDINQGQPLVAGDKVVDYIKRKRKFKKVTDSKICPNCPAIEQGETPYQQLDISDKRSK